MSVRLGTEHEVQYLPSGQHELEPCARARIPVQTQMHMIYIHITDGSSGYQGS